MRRSSLVFLAAIVAMTGCEYALSEWIDDDLRHLRDDMPWSNSGANVGFNPDVMEQHVFDCQNRCRQGDGDPNRDFCKTCATAARRWDDYMWTRGGVGQTKIMLEKTNFFTVEFQQRKLNQLAKLNRTPEESEAAELFDRFGEAKKQGDTAEAGTVANKFRDCMTRPKAAMTAKVGCPRYFDVLQYLGQRQMLDKSRVNECQRLCSSCAEVDCSTLNYYFLPAATAASAAPGGPVLRCPAVNRTPFGDRANAFAAGRSVTFRSGRQQDGMVPAQNGRQFVIVVLDGFNTYEHLDAYLSQYALVMNDHEYRLKGWTFYTAATGSADQALQTMVFRYGERVHMMVTTPSGIGLKIALLFSVTDRDALGDDKASLHYGENCVQATWLTRAPAPSEQDIKQFHYQFGEGHSTSQAYEPD
jgi:hypothetical protein